MALDPVVVPELQLVHYKPEPAFHERLRDALTRVAPEDRPNPAPEDFQPRYKTNEVTLATSDVVIENADLLKELADRFDDNLYVADTEAFGFLRSVEADRRAIFRGIADMGEFPRRKDWQTYAALAAALMLRDFLGNRYMPPDRREF